MKKKARATVTFEFRFGTRFKNCSKKTEREIELQVARIQEQFEAQLAEQFRTTQKEIAEKYPESELKITFDGEPL